MSPKKLGRYDLIRVLGRGAMGLVYEGRDPNLDRRVAIKTIKVENLSDEAAAEYEVRFRTEARSAARLQHSNIVSVYDSDRDGDIAFLVMEFVEGDDLKHHLDKGEVYTLQRTLSIMSDLLSALDYAHQQKIVHRDIKPANLLVQASGSIKLTDFGVARIQDSGDATRTQGSIVGTLKYMSPEQLEGRPIDARADLFAAGVVLYQLLTSQRPFDGDTDFAVIQKIAHHTPIAATSYNPKLPAAIDAVLAKALAKSRDMRYATANDFAAALQSACAQASDITITPAPVLLGRSSNITWTATVMPGESLVATEAGVGTGTGAGGTSGTSVSLVTQELELVYWKDVKDTDDIADLQGFLAKFPSGIYADLARRRLKSLGAAIPAEFDQTQILPRASSASEAKAAASPAAKRDQTAPLARFESVSVPPKQPADTVKPLAEPVQAPPVVAPKRTVWLIAGVAALALGGIAFKLLSGAGLAPELAASSAPASSPVPQSVASAAAPAAPASGFVAPQPIPALASVPGPVPVPGLAAPALVAAPTPRAPASTASRAALAASKAAATSVAKKAASDKTTANAAGSTTAQVQDPAQQAPKAVAASPTAMPAKASSPSAACEDRVLFAFQSCMSEQCAKPAFSRHPQCIERRGMDERRREAEKNR